MPTSLNVIVDALPYLLLGTINTAAIVLAAMLIGLLFSATPVTEVTASTDIRNAACLAVLANAGMGHVDTRQAEYKGEPCTEQVFSVRRLEDRQSVQAD